MKIALVYDAIHPYVVGGVEKRNWEIATRLVQRGHEVTLFGMKFWEGDRVFYSEGVRLWGVCPAQQFYTNGRRSIKQAIYFGYKVFPALSEETFDVIDVANFPYFPCFSAKLSSILKKSTLVITWHEVWGRYWYKYLGLSGAFGQLVERTTSLLTAHMITNSETTKRQLAKITGSKNVRVIPNGVDIEYIDRIVPSPERPDVLFAGRLIKEKNVDLLIRSIGILRETLPAVQCLIVGEGPEREGLEQLVGELDLNSNVQFTGFADNWSEVLSYMKSSKVFVLPSVREGFGMVVLEANACGLPVITVRHPQNAACDLVVDGQTGYIAEFSEQDVSEKVVQVIDQKEKWASDCMALAQGYDWNEITSETEAYYLNGIGRQKTVTR